ncbi:MAG: endopeptidase La [Chloroflexi bacterium]|nr:endopeptidase La [Chloroflexota bacterium]MBI3732761.1 endopeptidase La [Chloroflexota bacterium]
MHILGKGKPDEGNGKPESAPAIPSELSILPLRGSVVFPLTVLPLTVEQARSIQLVDEAALGARIIGLVSIREERAGVDQAAPEDLNAVGCAGLIHRLLKAPDGSVRLIVQGIDRIRIKKFTHTEPYLKAHIEVIPDTTEKGVEVEAIMRNTIDLFRRLVGLVPHLPDELMMAVMNVEDPRQLVYLIATSIRMNLVDGQEILQLDSIKDKLSKLNALLTRELEVLELGRKIQSEAQDEIGKLQRDYFLREQMKAIQKELGEQDEQAKELEEYQKKIEAAGMSEEAQKVAQRELARLKGMPAAAAEYSVIKTYIDWLVEMPWRKATDDHLDIAEARRILDEDHYDLEEVKERILEYLSVRKLRRERGGAEDSEIRGGAILCFVGPPGVGKTSLGQSIARALGRKFVRMSLGGMRDEAEIRGHRRTYIGAMPGRIVQSIKRAESRNPLIMLDEVDKIGSDWRGDPSSALLEVLDPAQNDTFRDHYLDVDWDLSQVLFITTANQLDPIPSPLRDRMEILVLDGYIEEEKLHIAQNYLIRRQMTENALKEGEITFDEAAIRRLIHDYTREAGVRNLERIIGQVARKVATMIAESKITAAVITEQSVPEYAGSPKYYSEAKERTLVPGVATGLSVSGEGGEILFIEATRYPTKREGAGLIITGQLRDVMKESAQIAVTYVRANAEQLDIDERVFDESDIHIHVPAGAVPKDGPSAGVTMTTAVASLLTGRRVLDGVAMTGEVTLRGAVLPVGGIKQKVLAAHRAGLTKVILPRRNERDIADLPEQVRQEMTFVLAERVNEVLENALEIRPVRDSHASVMAAANGATDGAKPQLREPVHDPIIGGLQPSG